MIRYLTVSEVLELYHRVMQQSGGGGSVRDLGGLESAVFRPGAMFAGKELHPTIADKAAALAFSLINNHPFVDGNKRMGHAAMEVFLFLNGFEIDASIDEQERIVIDVASGKMDSEGLAAWVGAHLVEKGQR